ncbi:fructose-bisphosphate aldolase [Candidatus Woesebacteria bacterium RIFCSPHIGHO2_01_FULL_39_17]|uniref:Probable fructose-bisphosphate aldolase class 1 n=3 Tax=Candidatus Woeseibacteriota TaxID=1752722 RepID=A0A0G0NKF2_9BACT|nr:MAG: Fructose-bisphosphate aldolase [Microgenomates group bacterium GW2011_GWC1_38_12]KKQ93360.1 MAG: Fructose-bisphosphate aldolase [Candidatus Woesebacteria bacterium GW2011_GWB1_39_10b]KKR13286.1 MAG: Fructose-bisphosphate aldolase [Candidatus Woesebacteria bacterium GW2011_GWA1_39_21b]OGM23225.1 MAG: fructose-bisphosphate aldolase [Candidatus Woesebacteria bacterium RIFCSPHIGHO2_01_FULL_39_17]OGM61119.1 MAG: fructose-bisphosphate aldolase [Candidatus Woesebacteria bacterium RIFCSPLOWO2_0
MNQAALNNTAKALVAQGKGILAADESTGTIRKRFDKVGVESIPENHRIYRQILFKTHRIEEFISGVIMFDETIRQTTDEGVPFAKNLSDTGIIPGIKVDKGTIDMVNFPGEKITQGLDGLRERLVEYKDMGARFSKWRAVITIGEGIPSDICINSNACFLAIFAALSQEADLVPIVEPEVLMDGAHDIKKSEEVTYKTLKAVFTKLTEYKIYFPGMLLKPNWVHPGKDSGETATDREIAEATLRVLKEVVPPEVPGIVFLSGGDNPGESTSHLDAMNEIDDAPWQLSFSFGRALQEPVLKSWAGKAENIEAAQRKFYKRAKLNSLARKGEYKVEMESI